jgi:CRISPR-associated protein Cas2
MTIIVTRDVAPHIRGFLASCMIEIAPGVYTSPRLSTSVRERVWAVITEWFEELGGRCIVMTWQDPRTPSGQMVRVIGEPPVELVDHDGVILSRRPDTSHDE